MNATITVFQADSLLFRPALPDDLERICTIIRQAQEQMRLRAKAEELYHEARTQPGMPYLSLIHI